MALNHEEHVSRRNDITVISLGPEYENLDEHALEEVKDVILEASSEADPPLVVLDLSHTRFFGSAFIEILFRAWNRVNSKEGGRFCISGLTSYCREVIEITHLDRLWDIYDNADDAVRALSSGM